jgi:hypothetical protein
VKETNEFLRGWKDAAWFVATRVGASQPAREVYEAMEVQLVKMSAVKGKRKRKTAGRKGL